MEKIGYIEKSKINLLNGLNSIDELKNIEIKYDSRDIVEESSDCIQFICAGVILTKDNRILIVNKSKKSTSSHSPEKDKTLLYVGGHLDIADSSKNNLQTFVAGMKREILEETGYDIKDNNIHNPILTYTSTTEKSAKHLGIIFPIVIGNCFNIAFTDGKCKFIDIDNLKEIENFESWSEIILDEIVAKFNSYEKLS